MKVFSAYGFKVEPHISAKEWPFSDSVKITDDIIIDSNSQLIKDAGILALLDEDGQCTERYSIVPPTSWGNDRALVLWEMPLDHGKISLKEKKGVTIIKTRADLEYFYALAILEPGAMLEMLHRIPQKEGERRRFDALLFDGEELSPVPHEMMVYNTTEGIGKYL